MIDIIKKITITVSLPVILYSIIYKMITGMIKKYKSCSSCLLFASRIFAKSICWKVCVCRISLDTPTKKNADLYCISHDSMKAMVKDK